MEESVIVVMLRNKQTGFLEKELLSFRMPEFESLLVNIFAEEMDGKTDFHMKVTTGQDVEDWQFNAIYDYYDDQAFQGEIKSIAEYTDCYNPTWEIVFSYAYDQTTEITEVDETRIDNQVKRILKIHQAELESVYEAIKDKEEAYTE